MLIPLDDYTIVNTNDIIKVTLNRKDRDRAWLLIKGEDKPIHIEPEVFYRLHSLISQRYKSSNHLKEPVVNKIDYTKPHRFEPIMDDPNTCTCGAHKDNQTAHGGRNEIR